VAAPDSSTLGLPAPSGDFGPPLGAAPGTGPDHPDPPVYPAAPGFGDTAQYPATPGFGDTAQYPVRSDYGDTSVYPAGSVYAPAPDLSATSRRGLGAALVAVVTVLALTLVAGIVAVVLMMRSGSDGTGSVAASAPPSAGATSSSSSGGGAAPATAAEAAAVLETFKPPASSLPPGIDATLIPQGDVAQGQQTLDGWCSNSYASEKDRIARRQWALTQNGQEIGLSIESVAYGTPAQAAAALAEFTARTQACHDVRLTSDGTPLVQNLVSSEAMPGLPTGVAGYRGAITVTATPATGAPFRLNSTSTVQQKGQYVTIVWTNQSTAITPADRAVIDRFVRQQTDALAGTTS
ncbi:MAG TPA: hypothetical protein VLV82_01685, partial [Candidatus Angelobacter sp.]|nr:hypothetical protein [Candidatus Angelobacter sp.]